MKRLLPSLLLAAVMLPPAARADGPTYESVWEPTDPGIAYAFAGSLLRRAGSPGILEDYTVAAQLTAKNGAGVDQWAFGVAAEAWALPGSRSILVGVEAAVINEEPANAYPKIAISAVMKNRADGGVDPGAPLNASSVAVWVSAQPGTGFERGLVFDRDALADRSHPHPQGRVTALRSGNPPAGAPRGAGRRRDRPVRAPLHRRGVAAGLAAGAHPAVLPWRRRRAAPPHRTACASAMRPAGRRRPGTRRGRCARCRGRGAAYRPIIRFGSHSAISGKMVSTAMVPNISSTNGNEPLSTVVSGTSGATPFST
jgi:hypothetical protein